MRTAATVLACAAIFSPAASIACLSSEYPKGVTVTTVTLPKSPASPFYYVRTFDYHYVIAFESRALEQLLSGGAAYGGQALLNDLHADANAMGDVDLSRYVLANPDHFSAVQSLSVLGLERAMASVVFLPDGSDVAQVTMHVDNDSGGYEIRFDANGTFLVGEVRCIAD